MAFPLLRQQRRSLLRRLLAPFLWSVLLCGGGCATIEYFYGPGEVFSKAHPFLMGSLAFAGLVGSGVAVVYFLVRLLALLGYKGRLKKTASPYLPPDSGNPLALLAEDLRCPVLGSADICLGYDWIVFPGRAMKRDEVAGVYFEDFSRRYLSKKVRITLVDIRGKEMQVDLPPKQHPDIYQYLVQMHPQADRGDRRRLTAFYIEAQNQGRQADGRRLKSPPPPAPLGLSRWDRSPILEENRIRSRYEEWLVTSYCVYLEGQDYHDGDTAFAGGFERTQYQREQALWVLEARWEVKNREALLSTVEHLVRTGRVGHDGWQLGRAPMVLGYGYAAGYITRRELLEHSLPVAKAIQETFSGWRELMDSYMASFSRWAGHSSSQKLRRRAYQRLLADPASLLNTVPFQLELQGRYQEALRLLGEEAYL